MRRNVLIAFSAFFSAFMLTSCLGHGSYVNNRSTNDNFNYANFVVDNPDSVYRDGYFYGTSLEFVFNVGVDESKNVTAGFGLSAKRDRSLAKRNDKCNEYCVYDASDASTTVFATFYQNPVASLNAKDGSDILFIGNAEALCSITKCQIANTGLVADMIINGAEGFAPFTDGDYLKVTFTGYMNEKKTGSVSAYLAQHKDGSLSVLKEWTNVDLSNLGVVRTVDITLESNREGLPLWFCLDNFNAQIDEEH